MKLAAYLVAALFLGAVATAQDAAKPAPADEAAVAGPTRALPDNWQENATVLRYEDKTCYTIRAYYFERSTSGTPEPAGMTTCVRSSPRALKKIEKKPAKSEPAIFVSY